MRVVIKTFRELTAEEFFRICEVREQVFVLEQKITLCAELDEQDLHSTHISLIKDGRIVAYARCYAENGSAHIGRVLTTEREKGYGLEVTEIVPIVIEPNKYNERYLKTKQDRMGHELHLK